MNNGVKITIVVLLAAAAAGMFALRGVKRSEDAAAARPPVAAAPATAPTPPTAETQPAATPPAPAQAPRTAAPRAVPRLIEFGSNRCMACQQMAVVLDALRASQGEKLRVDFFDVMENPELGEPYQISLIPTQILFDAAGKELYRHTGFFSHDDILAKYRALGVKL